MLVRMQLLFYPSLFISEAFIEGICAFYFFLLHGKNIFLPLETTKSKDFDEILSWLFPNFLTVKIFICSQDQKINGSLDKCFFGFLLS